MVARSAAMTAVCWVDRMVDASEKQRAGWWAAVTAGPMAAAMVDYSVVELVGSKAACWAAERVA